MHAELFWKIRSGMEPPGKPHVEYIARVSKKKFVKARIGSKAARHAERMDTSGDELEGEAATMYRALSARILYLSMDCPEISFSAKELCRHFAHPTKFAIQYISMHQTFSSKLRYFCSTIFAAEDLDFASCAT